MATSDEMRKRIREIEAEYKSVLNDPELTPAQKSEKFDTLESETETLQTSMKNKSRADLFFAAAEPGDDAGLPVEAKQVAPRELRLKANQDSYQQMVKSAAGRQRGSFSFEFGLKGTQGVAGLQGISADGTSAGDGLDAGDYFLEGHAGPSIQPQFIPGIAELRFYQNVIAGLFPNFPTDSPVVTYVREATWTNAAAATLEGYTKPTSTNTVVRYTEQLGKIANLVRVTDELIQDAPLFWSLIQNRGSQGVTRQEEVELLVGGGYPSVNGLIPRHASFTKAVPGASFTFTAGGGTGSGATSGSVNTVVPGRAVTCVAASFTTGVGDHGAQMAEGLLHAITDIRYATFYEPDAIIVNPVDWGYIRLSKDSAGQYLGGSFFGNQYGVGQAVSTGTAVDTGLSLWGKRVISTPAIPEGVAIVGAFADAGSVLRRGGLRTDITNTNGTDFEQNLWTARFEERVGLLIERPELFTLVHFINAGS